MLISEKIKFVGMIAILGGVGAVIYKSATQSDRLREAISEIRTAQSLITSSIGTIESAKGDIKGVREELKFLQTMAGDAQKDLGILRQERQQMEKTIKETLSNSRQVIQEQRRLVDEFQQQKKLEDAVVDSISALVTTSFSPPN